MPRLAESVLDLSKPIKNPLNDLRRLIDKVVPYIGDATLLKSSRHIVPEAFSQYSIGPLPLICLIGGAYFYSKGMLNRATERAGDFLSSFGLSASLIPIVYFSLLTPSPLRLLAAQLCAAAMMLSLFKLSRLRSSRGEKGLVSENATIGWKQLCLGLLISPFFTFAITYLPFLVESRRCDYRCNALEVAIGFNDDFRIYFVACSVGMFCVLFPVFATLRFIRTRREIA